ncbi:MAG: response regulator [Cyclobacteriaceae bacterium]|nr:response regulator [Cyclobacteriaceae bacterium]
MATRNQILIIDDDKAMCQLLEKLFENDYIVITKHDGMSAMHWLAQGNLPDLIISDLEMPIINGEEFIGNLKSSGFYNEVPFIVITGYSSKEQRLKCMKLGIHDYFEKPFNPKDLVFSVEVVLKHSLKKLSVL